MQQCELKYDHKLERLNYNLQPTYLTVWALDAGSGPESTSALPTRNAP
jgi:hypothetical protein